MSMSIQRAMSKQPPGTYCHDWGCKDHSVPVSLYTICSHFAPTHPYYNFSIISTLNNEKLAGFLSILGSCNSLTVNLRIHRFAIRKYAAILPLLILTTTSVLYRHSIMKHWQGFWVFLDLVTVILSIYEIRGLQIVCNT